MPEPSLVGELITLALVYDEPWNVPVPARYAEGMAYAEAQDVWSSGVELERRRVLELLWTPQGDEGDLTPKHLYRLLHETVARAAHIEDAMKPVSEPLERIMLLGRLEVLSRLSRHLTHVAAHAAEGHADPQLVAIP